MYQKPHPHLALPVSLSPLMLPVREGGGVNGMFRAPGMGRTAGWFLPERFLLRVTACPIPQPIQALSSSGTRQTPEHSTHCSFFNVHAVENSKGSIGMFSAFKQAFIHTHLYSVLNTV